MTNYAYYGNKVFTQDESLVEICNTLKPNFYVVCKDGFGKLYLEVTDKFTVPSKIYGDTISVSERIYNTYKQRAGSTGVLLSGEKGSGKTMLTKILSLKACYNGMPIIIVDKDYSNPKEAADDSFNSWIQSINQECVVIFDEFEKQFKADSQEKLLTLLDGTFGGKKLYLFTCNDKFKIDTNLKNRPSRIYYSITYDGLDESFIREYCEDVLTNKDHIDNIVKMVSVFSSMNFDMLQAFCEEMNRYGETPDKVLKYLNVKPEYSDKSEYTVTVTLNGNVLQSNPSVWKGNPLTDTIHHLSYKLNNKDAETLEATDPDIENGWLYTEVTPSMLSNINVATNTFEFKVNNVVVSFKKKLQNKYDYSKVF